MLTKLYKKLPIISSLVLAIAIFAIPTKTIAANSADFNPGRIIDDSVFTNTSSMSVNDIQNFLNSKVAVCDTNHQGGNPSYPPPYTCLKNFSEGGRSAAQIIWDTAQTYNVNPQVILVTLQKENGLVTDTWPYSWQYRTAMGMGCPDGANCDAQYFGFTNQVNQGTRHLHNFQIQNPDWYIPYRVGTNTIKWNPNAGCGTSQVNVENGATSALYSYTPYRPNQAALNNLYGLGDGCSAYGNRNFWRDFTDWFGSTNGTAQVIKGVNGSQLFAVWGTTKYYIPTYDMMIAWGLHHTNVSIVSDDYVASLSNGDQLSNLAKASDANTSLFMFDDGKRYPIPLSACRYDLNGQPNSNTSWSLDCFNTNVSKSYPFALIEASTNQDITLPNMIAFNGAGWKLELGKKRRIVDGLIVEVLGGWNQVRSMKDLNASQPEGKILMRNGYTVRFSNSATVYQYDSNQLNIIPSPAELSGWGLGDLHDFPASFNTSDPLPVGPSITQVAQDSNGTKYIVDKGYKLYFTPNTDSAQWPTSSPTTVLPETLNRLTAIPLSSIYLSEGSGQIYTVFGSKRYPFPTMDDFFALGFNPSLVRRVSPGIENLSGMGYGGMHLSNGRLFKINNNPHQIYMVYGSNSLYINSTNYPGLPYGKLITVDPITAARYPISGTYQP